MRLLTQLKRTVRLVLAWMEVTNQRRALRELSDEMLKDIGVNRDEANREANRPFWSRGPNKDGPSPPGMACSKNDHKRYQLSVMPSISVRDSSK